LSQAKNIGEKIKTSKEIIQDHMSNIESLRRATAINQLYENAGVPETHPDEEYHREAIEKEKKVYSDSIERIKQLKSMIENIQHRLERNQVQMQTSFDNWYTSICQRHVMAGTPVPISTTSPIDIQPKCKDIEVQSGAAEKVHNHSNYDDVEIPPGVVLTGDKQTDDDIIAFYKAKKMLLSRSNCP
jgi:hypothetical protein